MPKKSLDPEVKYEAVMSLIRNEEPASVIARRYGIAESHLYRLRDQFLDAGRSRMISKNGNKNSSQNEIKQLKKDVAEREMIIGELTVANRILKKKRDGLI